MRLGSMIALLAAATAIPAGAAPAPFSLEISQLTSGEKHHFFGYIGQCRTIPWNESGRYVLGLEIDAIDRMPKPGEAALIVLIDTRQNNQIIPIEKTRAWNPQQGTMFYWNPLAAGTQFFFNDRDEETGKIFTVLYDIGKRDRIREYRFDDTPVANGGVAQKGGAFLALNYGRMARLRPVTGYPGVADWSQAGDPAPANDGIFVVDTRTGARRLLVSFRQLADKLKEADFRTPDLPLCLNPSLWNRDGNRVYFFARGGWNRRGSRINVPFSIHSDGTNLTCHSQHIGGHPEWAEGSLVIGRSGPDQILYDIDTRKVAGKLGTPKIFPNPEGDVSLSSDGKWFVNGYKTGTSNHYVVYRRSDGASVRSEGFDKGRYSGDIRIDPAPRWNRTNDAILVPGLADNGTRQMFVIRIRSNE
ncbi:MAG: hypothetical protein QGH41_00795, partial [Roseibacillus sp.]|nr:hypothetical protein [Roseibacillus sp.]